MSIDKGFQIKKGRGMRMMTAQNGVDQDTQMKRPFWTMPCRGVEPNPVIKTDQERPWALLGYGTCKRPSGGLTSSVRGPAVHRDLFVDR